MRNGHRKVAPDDNTPATFVLTFRSLATALLALALPVGAVLPSATQADVLVSNLSEGSRSTATVGDSAGSQIVVAVEFETGSHTKGYTLTSIRAALSNAVPADGVRVRLFNVSLAGTPGSSLLTFDNPTISNGTKTFTAPANTTLQKDTQYFLVFDSTAADANYGVGATESDSLTSAVAGWELNASRRFTFSGGSWQTHYATLRVEINGAIKPNATGKPGVRGFPQAGESLTATAGDINDVDGLPAFPSGFTFQWVRVDGTTETDIPGATSSTYDPVAADIGKQIKVKVSYTDNTGAAEGPLESDPTDDAVLAARAPCPSRSDWCTEMTVRQGSGSLVPLGFSGGSYGSIDDDSFDDGTISYEVNAIWLLMDPLSGTNTVAVTLDAFLPRGSVFHIGGKKFTADASSEQAGTGQYQWPAPSGLSWVDGQKVTVSMRFALPVVTIAPVEPSAVYGRDDLEFVVSRTVNTLNAIDVSVELTQYRKYLKDTALSQVVTIPAGASSAILTIPKSEYGALNDGVWMIRDSKIKATIKKGAGHATGSPASASVEMGIAMTVGFGPYASSYRVDEGSGSVDVTFYAISGPGLGAPMQRVEVKYSTADGSATAPGDYQAGAWSFFFERDDFEYVRVRDWYRATKTVTLTIISEDSIADGDETFLLRLERALSNGPEVVYVDDRGIRGVSCTPGETCAAEITIVDNDGITTPTEHPDWTLRGSDRTFAGTSSNRRPTINGTESAVRCLNSSRPFQLLDHQGNRVSGDVEYSFRQIPGRDVASHRGLPKPSEMPTLFTIDGSGQIRTVVGKNYLHYEDSLTQLRYTDVIVRALHTASNRYAEYRLDFNIVHPSRTDKDHLSPLCSSMLVALEPLTAEFANMPASHDGSPFTFRLAFSDDVYIEPDEMRDHALLVSDGAVTGASRVDGRNDLWEITVEPAGTANVGIVVPQGRACTEQGALCTSDGRTLSTTVPAQVIQYAAPGMRARRAPVDSSALTASFAQVPGEHDGSSVFTLELAFTEAVFDGSESFDKNQAIQNALRVTGGTVRGRRRVDPVAFDRWILRIGPSGHGDVKVSLPATTGGCSTAGAICTPGGKALLKGVSATIQGPPALSVADAEVTEGPGAKLQFTITLSRAASGTVTVQAATSDGSALAGDDYEAKSRTKTFAPGETSKVFRVKVIDDDHDEDSETMMVTLSSPSGAYIADGEATGTIANSDPMPQAWLARFARTVAEQIVDAAQGRLRGPPAAGPRVTLAGERIGAGPGAGAGPERAGRRTGWRPVETRELLTGSSFALTVHVDRAGGGIASLWGRGAWNRFDGREGDLTLSGEVTNAIIGADWTRGPGSGAGAGSWTAGLMLSHARGEGTYRGASAGGKVESTSTGLYPYGRYAMTDRVTVWGVAGYGAGPLTLKPEDGAALRTDMDLMMAAGGLRGFVVKAPAEGGPEVSVETDALAVRARSDAGNLAAATGEATRLWLGVTTAWRGLEVVGGALEPKIEVGVRHDGGDAEPGFGLDAGAGLAWSRPEDGLQLQLSGRGLLTHESKGFREQGVAASLAWQPRAVGGRGPKLTVTHTLGGSLSGGASALLGRRTLSALAANDDGDPLEGRSLEVRFGYGFAVFGDRFTASPEVGFGMSNGRQECSLGWVLNLAQDGTSALEFALEASRREAVNDNAAEPEHTAGFRVTARW